MITMLAMIASLAAAPTDTACYAKVGPLLQTSGGKLSNDVRNGYLGWAEASVLQALKQAKQIVPDACLEEVRKDPTARDAVFGAVYPPDPSILQNLAQLRTELGPALFAKYRSLAIGVAVAKRTKGVEILTPGKDLGRDYQAGFWTDESLQVPGSEPEREFVREIADFMKTSNVGALDLYRTPGLQQKLSAYVAQKTPSSPYLREIGQSVQFGERIKNAMILLGQRPGAREKKPGTAAWLKHLIAINEATPSSTPSQMSWPLFPIASAPWPLLMPLAHPVPLSEANYIWEAFQGQHGADRYHTYGPYLGDNDVMPLELQPSKWFWDAWPDRIVHGGMCVPISKGTVDLYSSLGKPSMWAGQPGHANLITFQAASNGAWTAEIEQAFAGGPDVTCAQWYFDEDPGSQLHYRDLYYWPGAEYQLGLAVGMNIGLRQYMDTRIAANIFRAMPASDRPNVGVKLLRSAIQSNPYNPELWYRLADATTDPIEGLTLIEAAMKHDPGRLVGTPGSVPVAEGNPANNAYWQTICPVVTQYGIFSHGTAASEEDAAKIYKALKKVPGASSSSLVACAEGVEDHRPEAVKLDLRLASEGDAFGQLRLGQRYRDGDGVSQDDGLARSYLAKAAGQGDAAASILWSQITPAVPSEWISVSASSSFGSDQLPRHLIDGAGMSGATHDNQQGAQTMWHTIGHPPLTPPARGLRPSPAWVRFDFTQPTKFDAMLIWNENQPGLTDRGFRRVRIYGSPDGTTWTQLSYMELPRANGSPYLLPGTISNDAAKQPFKAVIIAAEPTNGNFGAECYGLSAVRFLVPTVSHVVPAKSIIVAASSTYSETQSARHLIDGTGMLGALHDNQEAANSMWHTPEHPALTSPGTGIAASPAWIRFDFAQPQAVDNVLVWNHNQQNLTDRGLRKVRLYGTTDGATWFPLTGDAVEIPRASGTPNAEPFTIPTSGGKAVKSIVIAADATDGSYGGSCYGLSAVRFVTGKTEVAKE